MEEIDLKVDEAEQARVACLTDDQLRKELDEAQEAVAGPDHTIREAVLSRLSLLEEEAGYRAGVTR